MGLKNMIGGGGGVGGGRGEGGEETKQKADISKGEDIEIRSDEVGTRRE